MNMKREDAEEYTQSLGQIVAGSWRQIALAKRLGVPNALGLTTEVWVKDRLGGYIKQSRQEQREAVKALTADGHSNVAIGEILGVDEGTVRNVRSENSEGGGKNANKNNGHNDSSSENSEPIDAYAALNADEKVRKAAEKKRTRAEMRDEDEARVKSLAPVIGKFRALVIDPPWDYEWLSIAGRAAPGYATMSHEELLALDVAQWAEENCHLYLWTTNNFMTRAVDLMAHWGFQHKCVLTWVKPRWGLGSYFRNSTEHVLFGMRGELRTRSDSIATHFRAPLGKHSEKPEEFYDLVRAASHEPFGEVFQREDRSDFTNVFGQQMVEAAE